MSWIWQAVIGAALGVNILCGLFFLLKKEGSDSTADEIKMDMMLLNRNFFSLKREVEELIVDVRTMGETLRSDGETYTDEIGGYLKKGFSHDDIARKMNKSVKEIDLMVKLRGKKQP